MTPEELGRKLQTARNDYLDTVIPDIAKSIEEFIRDINDTADVAAYIAQRLEPLRPLLGSSWELKAAMERILMDGRTLKRGE